jgi:hypothetical protein
MSGALLPLSHRVQIEPLKPVHKLWHIPDTGSGVCPGCGKAAGSDPFAFGGHDWHNDCFTCSLCREPFTDTCIPKDDFVLHQECFAECFCDRCAKCARHIPPKKAVDGGRGKLFHSQCYACTKCGDRDPLSAKQLVFGFPYCQRCYDDATKMYPKCLSCPKTLLPGDQCQEFVFQGRKYFAHTENCCKCAVCAAAVTVGSAAVYADKLLCPACFKKGIAHNCASCNNPIFKDAVEMNGVFWHTPHFACCVCKKELKLANASFTMGHLRCKTCASEDRQKCGHCRQPVEGRAIHACGAVYHPDCLVCIRCQLKLEKVVHQSLRGKPICLDCSFKLQKEGLLDKRGRALPGKMVEDEQQRVQSQKARTSKT